MTAIGTRKLTIEIDGTEYTDEVSNARITNAEGESDFTTFAEAAAGGARDFFLAVTLVQDLAPGSLWRAIWDNSGDDVPFTIAAYGNAAPSLSEGHIEGTCTLTLPDGDVLGGEANKSSTARFTVEAVFPCTAKPSLVTAP